MKTLSIMSLILILTACSGSVGKDMFPGDAAKGDNEPSTPASLIELKIL